MSNPGPTRLLGLAAAAGVVLATVASAAPDRPDPAKLEETRSLVAEGVVLETNAARGRVTARYAEAVREALAHKLGEASKDPALAPFARAALAALNRGDVRTLAAIRDQLVRTERANGRAG